MVLGYTSMGLLFFWSMAMIVVQEFSHHRSASDDLKVAREKMSQLGMDQDSID